MLEGGIDQAVCSVRGLLTFVAVGPPVGYDGIKRTRAVDVAKGNEYSPCGHCVFVIVARRVNLSGVTWVSHACCNSGGWPGGFRAHDLCEGSGGKALA